LAGWCNSLKNEKLTISIPRRKIFKIFTESVCISDIFRKFAVLKIGLEPRKWLIFRRLTEFLFLK